MLVDLAISLLIIGIFLMAVIPTVRPEEHVSLIAASSVLAADIEYAQSATLAAPGDPTVVRFGLDGDRYWLALASDPETPIPRPNSSDPYETVFGEGNAENLWSLSFSLVDVQDATIEFDAFGRLTQAEDPRVGLTNESGTLVVRVRAATGSVSVESGS